MKIKNFKMRVTPEQSEQVQRILFDNGYRWISNCTGEPNYLTAEFIWLENKVITCNYGDENYFTSDKTPELTFYQFMGLYGKEGKK